MMPDWEGKAERLFQWIAEGKNSPYTLEIHPTFRCNLHCIFCDQEDWRQRGIVDFSLEMGGKRWLKVIDEAAEMGVREVRLCGGGEPMYEPRAIVPIFKRIKAHGMSGYLTTNGTMFNEDLCQMMIDIGWDKIEFSIDGDNAETHDSLRGVQGCFERVVEAVRTICEYRYLMKRELPYIIISFVVNKRNFMEIPGMVRLFGPMGVDQLLLLTLHPTGMAGDSLVIPPSKRAALWDAIRRARQLADKHEMYLSTENLSAELSEGKKLKEEIVTPHETSPSRRNFELEGNPKVISFVTVPCYEPWYYMQILHDGLYSPCCNSYFKKTSETFHKKTLKELWLNGSHMRKVRADILRKKLKEVCGECDAVNLVRTKPIRDHLLWLCEKNGLLPADTIRIIRECPDTSLDREV